MIFKKQKIFLSYDFYQGNLKSSLKINFLKDIYYESLLLPMDLTQLKPSRTEYNEPNRIGLVCIQICFETNFFLVEPNF